MLFYGDLVGSHTNGRPLEALPSKSLRNVLILTFLLRLTASSSKDSTESAMSFSMYRLRLDLEA